MSRRYRYVVGQRVRVVRRLSNGWCALNPGAVVTITRRFKGYYIQSDTCEHCKVAIKMTRVPENYLDPIQETKP